MIWNEQNPKIISTKYIPHEDLIPNPSHQTLTQIKGEKHQEARVKADLLPAQTEVKDVKEVNYNYEIDPPFKTQREKLSND